MASFQAQTFQDTKIALDGNDYVRCTFEKCSLVFSGSKPVKFIECVFGKEVSWSFAGSAALTLNFMRVLYHGAGPGGQALIERTFEHIRKGKPGLKTSEGSLN